MATAFQGEVRIIYLMNVLQSPVDSNLTSVPVDVPRAALSLGRYFSIDDVRIKDIRENTLHDLTLNEQDWKTGPMWLVGHNKPISHRQGDIGFGVGR
jgi:hypothetical protein